ncbi:serine/threonine-protein kinase pim-1 [Hippoglossus stenolepis]|uniref:serine/threonine-protein kinase pim-1 n=1 Tax=Hippoglossus stenolepis TaxID=195615 RepID=UPI001FAFC1D7|nr:serine/threonine-protein kinase pim-1 [Hippoglossus stenolepis]
MNRLCDKVLRKHQGEPCEEVGRLRGRKRKERDDEEGKPEKRKRRRVLDSNEHDSAEADMIRISRKRNFSADGGEVREKKRRVVEMKTLDASGDNPIVDLEAKYFVLGQLGGGGCGSVFAGFRREDLVPVAIKHIPKENLYCKQVCLNGKKFPTEVAIMLKLTAKKNDSVGTSAPVSILDWYDLGHELIVVMERPVPAIDLSTYIKLKRGSLQEGDAKNIMKQLVDAAIGLEKNGVFHRDIKPENILIEIGQSVPRVRVIDFGLSCLTKKGSFYSVFFGTEKYAPPEYCSSSVYRAGPSTVWQLGTVLYEMLHNQGFMTKRFLRKQLKISSGLGKNLKDFLQLCLEKDPKLRPTLTELQLHPWLRETSPPNPDKNT